MVYGTVVVFAHQRVCPADTCSILKCYYKVILTLNPSSQLIQRHPLVRKHPTAWRAMWWIQPSCLSCLMIASIHGKPVLPCQRQTDNFRLQPNLPKPDTGPQDQLLLSGLASPCLCLREQSHSKIVQQGTDIHRGECPLQQSNKKHDHNGSIGLFIHLFPALKKFVMPFPVNLDTKRIVFNAVHVGVFAR